MKYPSALLFVALGIACQSAAHAAEDAAPDEEIEFNDQFLMNTGTNIDVSRFSKGNPVIAGTYKTQIVLNGQRKLLTNFTFNENGTPRATPCFTHKLLLQLGIKTEGQDDPLACIDLQQTFSGSSWEYDTSTQELTISMPQIYVQHRPNGYVDASLWDEGITAGLLSWDLNAWHSDGSTSNSDSAYAGLKYGFNFGPWRLRSRGTLDWDPEKGSEYSSQDVYLQRDITPLGAQMLIGNSYTRGDTFNAINLLGVRLYNDDRMLPGGISTFAPVIRGVAKSNAKVTVSQSGNTIYESAVPPGEFAIDDLSTVGYGSDLLVSIEESDGSVRTFSVPYSSVSQLLRPGYSRWDIGAGKLDDSQSSTSPSLIYATGYYGINNTFTGYAGVQYMETDFVAGLIGVAMNTGLGAFALDITHSDATITGPGRLTGESYRLSWSKLVEQSNTSFNVAAYRFSTENYLTLNDAATLSEDEADADSDSDDVYNHFQHMKNQFQINISQPLAHEKQNYGSMYLNGSWQNYWNQNGASSQYSVGYNNAFSLGSYSITLQRSYDEYGVKDDSVYLNLSIPLENLFSQHRRPGGFSSLNMSVNSDLKGRSAFNSSANGNSDDGLYSYSVNATANQGDAGNINQLSGYGNYNSAYGPLSLSASAADDNSQQYSMSYSGGMMVHSGGVTFAPGSIGDTDTLALVSAPGAKGAHLSTGDGVIGQSGYAIMPYLAAYRENTIGLDITDIESDVEVINTSTIAVPRSGAVIRVDFATDQGRSLLLELERSDHQFIPLGADVLNEQGVSIGAVGQAGQAYVRGIDDSGTLRVVWGSGPHTACRVAFRITSAAQKVGLTTLLTHQQCQME
nr:outer membrane usher protein [uncultured Enterobacter sp.]